MTTWDSPATLWDDLTVTWDGTRLNRQTYTPPPRALAELLASSHPRLVQARVLTGPAAGTDLPVTAGSLTWTYDDPVRLSGNVTVAALPEWTLLDAHGGLDPRAGVEIGLATGIRDDTGTQHWWPYGIVRPVETTVATTPAEIQVTSRVIDRGGIVSLARIDRSWIIPAGDGILAGVLAALAHVAPWLPVDLPLEEDITAATDIVLAEKAGDDIWSACRDRVRSLGRLLHVDAAGVVVAPLVTMPQATAPIEVPVTGWSAGVHLEQVVHQVAAVWTQPRPDGAPQEWTPESGTEFATDAETIDALPEGVPVTTRAYAGDASVLATAEHARAAALVQLADHADLAVSGSCNAVPHPDLIPGAVIADEAGLRFRVTELNLNIAGGDVAVALGAACMDFRTRLTKALGYRDGMERDEIVVDIDPLTTRAPGDPAGTQLLVEPSDATKGVAVGDVVRVRHDGAGRRVAVALLTPKPLAAKFAGESLGTVGGAPVTVGGNTTLRARIGSSGSYTSFSGGDVTLPTPPAQSHRHNLPTFTVSSPSPMESGAAATTGLSPAAYDTGLRSAYNSLRSDVMALRSDLAGVVNRLNALSGSQTTSAP